MDYYTPQPSRRHNPVDSICRKLQTIQWRGDREPNTPFQIPKLSSSSYDSPQCGLRHNLEAILKKSALYRDEGERGKEKEKEKVKEKEKGKGSGMPTSASSQNSSMGPAVPLSTPSTPALNPPAPANITYTITSTLGERRGADGSDLKQVKTWEKHCSTPTGQPKDSPYFTFTRGPRPVQPESERPSSSSSSPPLSRTFTPSLDTLSYNLNFCSAETTDSPELSYPALVVKRLSMGDGVASENYRKENMAEISLICEENLLDTIFHACDTQRRGKVFVSHIVDYLRHTTSRSSQDSGLEELCNMLDPEQKDVSIDLDTYHAVMKEWIDDCRNNGEEPINDLTQDSVKVIDSLSAKRSVLLNMTSGSLEAFGGDASRVDFETSDLVYCVADLQMWNQKLQEEVRKLKLVAESMEDTNQKLAEENEHLRNQARVSQLLAQKEKLLNEEVEEMKATLSCTEEGRARASAHSKHVERENQSLIVKIASLQEENFKVTMETDELQRRIAELCNINDNLQVQIHSFDTVVGEKEAVIHERSKQIEELRAAVEEYSSITQLLRANKNKLESQVQMMHPDLAGASLSLSVAYRLNQSTSGSLQTELALAQSPLEVSPGDGDLDWDEEFALQDFLKNELAEKKCRTQDGQADRRPEDTGDRVTDRGKEENGDERWMVVDTVVEGEVRDMSTPLSFLSGETRPGHSVEESQDTAACAESETEVNSQSLQEEAAVLLGAHSQAVSIRHPEADALPAPSHSENNADVSEAAECPSENVRSSPEQDQTVTPGQTPPSAAEMVSPSNTSHGPETVTANESTQPTCEDQEKKGEADSSTGGGMSFVRSLSQDQLADRSAPEDSTSLLPVLVEEEESVPESTAEASPVAVSMEGTDRLDCTNSSSSSSPQSGAALTHATQSGSGTDSVTSDLGQSEDNAAIKDAGKKKKELEVSRSMEAIEEQKVQEDHSDTGMTDGKKTEISLTSDALKDGRISLSPNDKEIEAEFQRLALGFKCDMFTMEKRLRLEERSRDLAEENVRREVSSCQGLLQALTPLCEDDTQSMEIIQRLKKNLDILIQSMTRVSSRSEMLGAIHQESRIGKAVEVMIQHVENLRRMYTKEHAELLELREALMQNERSFGSQTERAGVLLSPDDFRGKGKATSQYYKPSTRRVSIAAMPRTGGGNMHFDMSKTQDGSEAETERLTRRSMWNVAGKSTARPPLKRFVSSAAWVDTEEPALMMKGTTCDNTDWPSEDEQQKEEPVAERRRSSLSELGNIITSFILPNKTPSPPSSPTSTDPGVTQSLSHSLTSSREAAAAAVARGGRGLWLWLALLLVLAGLLALLASLVMQPVVDAAPVGTGDSWMTIQQLLWPYAGLRHNGQPPV
ncbi:inositol 1,4,5-triphosphate receptor associated 2 [Pleuronectes platessa]|uniref:inositol 1,4,5-triphosphate receptor associated 2 n=1 Tax=Pleuronectes platessa TaxID=8262 RepID=UPI00232A657B|nr:inositol 1,4,5-triphosphate receptor associated 2 [Pleuronectes platessa]